MTLICNLTYLKRYLEKEDAVLIKGVRRTQGMMIPRGNPKNIIGVTDLSRIQTFISVLKSREFNEASEQLGGYGLDQSGDIARD